MGAETASEIKPTAAEVQRVVNSGFRYEASVKTCR